MCFVMVMGLLTCAIVSIFGHMMYDWMMEHSMRDMPEWYVDEPVVVARPTEWDHEPATVPGYKMPNPTTLKVVDTSVSIYDDDNIHLFDEVDVANWEFSFDAALQSLEESASLMNYIAYGEDPGDTMIDSLDPSEPEGELHDLIGYIECNAHYLTVQELEDCLNSLQY